ncbi:hypothetical protein BASA50_000992 [Batrachochytrium salamandrivorans]|uniref:Small ribosomal subunit protein uS10 domain-containing protein n=1 Tax=Batrachochytrium salamandrivorans TaxID=1357716 RepID=A0ABQ8EUZ4_9FUNG|nr:hypothetical protein BASA60_010814 [Batrachochytrium salamandrivorans]KAH6581277.1 hypothetical protein BASA61_009165 [Batrachochytrium salamandrivorans]KAH6585831.1 hypothetical protein BASA50_000992 [Batrachochytrium salamandrivorans]KAH9269460.1 hypothetical protein BASA83_008543 [Batrachochytrium salamandrivorans]KAJ1341791.1 hypothetical protein BSLG_003611 [Batrachochytrium salamandrivorans]
MQYSTPATAVDPLKSSTATDLTDSTPASSNKNTSDASFTIPTVAPRRSKVRDPQDYYSWHTLEFQETPRILVLPEPARSHNQLVCNLQLSGYMPDHLDFMAYFARYTAKAMGMPVSETIHLRTHVRRWHANKGPFVHAKTKEIFERKTYYRLVQVFDTHPDTVKAWATYINESLPAGIDLKVDRWEWEAVGFAVDIPMPDIKGQKTHAQKIQEQADIYIKQFSK